MYRVIPFFEAVADIMSLMMGKQISILRFCISTFI